MNILKRTWGVVVHNFGWRVLALALAVTIWGMVASEPELSMFATVPVQYRNLPADLDMSSPAAETVTLELRGPSAELQGLGGSRSPSVVLDMGMWPGAQTSHRSTPSSVAVWMMGRQAPFSLSTR